MTILLLLTRRSFDYSRAMIKTSLHPNQTFSKPLLRGHLHQSAFFFFLGACVVLFLHNKENVHYLSLLIYALSLLALFGISAIYHRPNWSPEKRVWMRRLDHAAIYILIAGTATPLCLMAIPRDVGNKLLLVFWVMGIAGILQSLFWINASKKLVTIFYIIMGTITFPYLSYFQEGLGPHNTLCVLLGGASYITGAIIYALKKPNPIPHIFGYHEIFHFLVIVGALFHFIVIYLISH